MASEKLTALVNEWLSLDKNKATHAEIESLVAEQNWKELSVRLEARMEFGTAGLRAAMAAGYSRMNDLTIIQTSQGFAKYLLQVQPAVQSMGVVIGFDGRHNSHQFARLAAVALASQGIKVYLFSSICPTPFVPYCVKKYGAGAGIMVTASHNPKDDNGYKVYWENGAQIISPHDKGISSHISQNLLPWDSAWDVALLDSKYQPLVHDPLSDALRDYMDAIKVNHYVLGEKPLKITYTAMHGVGHRFTTASFGAFGLPPYIPVPEQISPDPEFPTVKFPNPEEGKSALDLAIRTATSHNSRLILANDPDADRLAVAEQLENGTWKIFTGNEIGALLAWWQITQYKKSHQSSVAKVAMVASTVSSKLIKSMAEKEGFRFEETLTGFKWIGNKVIELQKEGHDVIFAFEEAIGFMVGTVVYDKDGVCAAAVMAEMANELDKAGLTLHSQLKQIYSTYGYFASLNSYYLCYSQPTIQKIFGDIRRDENYPKSVAGHKILHVRDLTTGYDDSRPDRKAVLPSSSSSQMVTFYFENGAVITIRTSGTEPKIKYYTEMKRVVSSEAEFGAADEELRQLVSATVEVMLRPAENGLVAKSD